jgi:hypothetical protein
MPTARLVLVAAACALSAFAACKPQDLPVTPLDDVCSVESGTTVSTAGFLAGPGGSMWCDGTTCEMALSNRGVGGHTSIRIDVRLGSGRNAMVEPPDQFSPADLIVKDNEGVERPVGSWVIVQGRILTGEACLITPVSYVISAEPPAMAAGEVPEAAPTGAAAPAVPTTAAPTAAPAQPPTGTGGNKPTDAPPAAPAKP